MAINFENNSIQLDDIYLLEENMTDGVAVDGVSCSVMKPQQSKDSPTVVKDGLVASGIKVPEQLMKNLLSTDSIETKNLTTAKAFDGIAVASKSLSILNLSTTVKLGGLNRDSVEESYGSKFKGMEFLYDKRVYKVRLCDYDGWKVSLLYLSDHFLPRTYVEHGKLAARVSNLIKDSIKEFLRANAGSTGCHFLDGWSGNLSNGLAFSGEGFSVFSKILRNNIITYYKEYCKQMKKRCNKDHTPFEMLNFNKFRYTDKLPSLKTWDKFGEQPFTFMQTNEDNWEDRVWFLLERYGMDMHIPPHLFSWMDLNEDTQKKRLTADVFSKIMNELDETLKSFSNGLQLENDLKENQTKVVIHYALDHQLKKTENSDGNILFWNAEKVEKALKYNYKKYHPFGLPLIGNLQSQLPIGSSVNFYARFWHEAHRNVNKWFSSYRITEQVLALIGSKMFPGTRKVYTTVMHNHLKNKIPVTLIDNLLRRAREDKSPTVARFEMQVMVELEEMEGLNSLNAIFLLGLQKFTFFHQRYKLSNPDLFISIERQNLISWLSKTVVPASNVIRRGLELLNAENFKAAPILNVMNDIHYSEFLLSYFLFGEKKDMFSVVHETDLGLDILRHLSIKSPEEIQSFVIKHALLQDYGGVDGLLITFLLPRNFIDEKMMPCIISKLMGETCDPIFKKFKGGINWRGRKYSRNTIKGRKNLLETMSDYILHLFEVIKNAENLPQMKEYKITTKGASKSSNVNLPLTEMRNKVMMHLTAYGKDEWKDGKIGPGISIELDSFPNFWRRIRNISKTDDSILPGEVDCLIKYNIMVLEHDKRNAKLLRQASDLIETERITKNSETKRGGILLPMAAAKLRRQMENEKTYIWTFSKNTDHPDDIKLLCVFPEFSDNPRICTDLDFTEMISISSLPAIENSIICGLGTMATSSGSQTGPIEQKKNQTRESRGIKKSKKAEVVTLSVATALMTKEQLLAIKKKNASRMNWRILQILNDPKTPGTEMEKIISENLDSL